MGALNGKGDFGSRPRQTQYEVVDKDGNVWLPTFDSATAAAEWAHEHWPSQEQDEDRTGKGWDLQVVGCDLP